MNKKIIYMAGGCFWGLQRYFDHIKGITNTKVGYINGNSESTTYEKVSNSSGHAEVVKAIYDSKKITLKEIFYLFIKVIDPTSINKQGYDEGIQYRSGIYSDNIKDLTLIRKLISIIQKDYDKNIAIQVENINNYVDAEDYHQKYLNKNPSGFCSIKLNQIEDKYRK